jgi:hypothetical protein
MLGGPGLAGGICRKQIPGCKVQVSNPVALLVLLPNHCSPATEVLDAAMCNTKCSNFQYQEIILCNTNGDTAPIICCLTFSVNADLVAHACSQ